MATTVTKSIGTNARDFSTITAWEAAIPADIRAVGTDEIHQGECFNDSVFTDADFIIDGTTTSGGNYIELTVATGESHAGTRGTGVLLRPPVGQVEAAIRMEDNHVRLFMMEIDGVNVPITKALIAIDNIAVLNAYYIGNNLLYDNQGDAGSHGINIVDTSVAIFVYGNIIINMDGIGAVSSALLNISSNNTVYKCNQSSDAGGGGYKRVAGTVSSLNDACLENDTADWVGTFTVSENNMSSDATAPGTLPIINADHTREFTVTTAGSEDVHPKNSLPEPQLINSGLALSMLNVFPDNDRDADGNMRGQAGWDIGAYEFTKESNIQSMQYILEDEPIIIS